MGYRQITIIVLAKEIWYCIDSLRQMMSDGLAYRHDYHEQPPRVEYGLTELGTKMLPIVNSLADFGNYYKSLIEQN